MLLTQSLCNLKPSTHFSVLAEQRGTFSRGLINVKCSASLSACRHQTEHLSLCKGEEEGQLS